MLMAKPACGARKPIKNQEGQGMLDIDENTSVEDDMFENVKTDEDMDHEMEEEEGGSAFEEESDPDESDQQEQAVIPKSQTPFLSEKTLRNLTVSLSDSWKSSLKIRKPRTMRSGRRLRTHCLLLQQISNNVRI